MSEKPEATSSDDVLSALVAHNTRVRERKERIGMRRRYARRVATVGGGALVLALIGFNIVVWGGYLDVPLVSSTPDAASSVTRSSTPTSLSATTLAGRAGGAGTTKEPPVVRKTPSAMQNPRAPAPGRADSVTLRMTSVRGDCWAIIRREDSTGDVIYDGVITKGTSVTVKGKQLWVRFGALGNLDLVLNGKPIETTHSGTVDLRVTAHGLRD